MKIRFQIPSYIPRLRPWALAAVLMATGLLGYYLFLAVSYWGARQSLAATRQEITRLALGLGSAPNEEAASAQLQSNQQALRTATNLFGYGDTGDVPTTLVATAEEAVIVLTSMAVGDAQAKAEQGIKYQVQPVTLGLRGPEPEINRFVSLLRQKAPAVSVTSIRMGNLATAPEAQVQLIFYASPEPVPEKTPQPTPSQGKAR